MYKVHFRPKLLIAVLFFTAIIYGSQLFIISVHQWLSEQELNTTNYMLPIYIILFFMISILLSLNISETLYSYVYILLGLYLGYILIAFQIAVLCRIILSFITVESSTGLLLLYFTPLIICLYGIVHAKITKKEEINFKYPGYNSKIKILHLSDIHLGAIHQKNSILRIVKEIQEIEPDIVVITGDMADGSLKVKPDWLMPFDNIVTPILYVTGNHEEMNPKNDMLEAVAATHIKHIGKHETFKFKGVNFIGEDFGHDLTKCLNDVRQEPGVPNVLLYHVPNLKPEDLGKYNIFLMLAGHTHGGQIFPLQIMAYLTNACFSGLYSDETKKHHVYVTDGVNNAVAPMRIGSDRVFPIITIEGVN